MKTTFENKCYILSEVWTTLETEPLFREFFIHNDISLPLAYMLTNNIVTGVEDSGKSFIEESFDSFLEIMEVEDTGFEELSEVAIHSQG